MLFKILRGPSTRISKDKTEFHDGYAYFTPDDGGFYIDAEDTDTGAQNRIRVNPVMEHQDISGLLNKTGDASNTTATFTAPSARENIKTGEKLSVIMGKIAKWFSSLGTLAFKSSVAKSDLAADVQTSLGKADTVPTKVSELPNDANYITADQAPVQSVNNKTGAVSLTASDVDALPADTIIPTVNNATLTIKRNSIDVGSFAANAANDVNIDINVPTDKSDIGLGNVDNVKQYSATNPPPYPVTSVNGKTGAVSVNVPSASSTIPKAPGTASAGTSAAYAREDHIHPKQAVTKSDVGLGNVDNVKQYSASNPPPYPVTSVNGQTGEVNLVASEVGAVPTSRTVNGKALSANITLTASDVGAATMTQVNSAIQTAIGNAIGGSY